MKLSRVVATGMLLAIAGGTGASAQVVGPANVCDVFVDSVDVGLFNTCAAGELSRLNTIYIPYVVARAVANSFAIGPRVIAPPSLQNIVAGEADEPFAVSPITIIPTADVAAAAPAVARNWNAWADGRYIYSDYSASGGGLDGGTGTGIVGLDYKLTSKLTFGMLATAEKSALDSALNDYNSQNLGLGPYLGWVLTDNIVFSANAQRSWIDADSSGGALNFKTDRVQASAAVNGYWYDNGWRYNPSLTLTWSKDWETETNGLFPDRKIEVGVFVPAMQVGKTLKLNDTTTLEPWAGAALDVTFLDEVAISGGGTVSNSNTDLRLQAGLNFGFGSNAQLAITGEAAGLLQSDFNSYSIEANLAVQF